jgi:glucose-6-phosphate 1-dehydrogenase
MAENFGIQGRGPFYEEAGAIRDVFQNHMLQVVSILMMEPPGSHSPDGIRDEKVQVLRSIRPLAPDNVVRGQYRGYRAEAGVAENSHVETFAAVRMEMDSWRWSDVPILIRAGKCLARTATEVLVRFRIPPQRVIARQYMDHSHNYIRIRLNPEEVIALGVAVRKEGESDDLQPVELTVSRTPVDEVPPYARLLQAAMAGDTSLFSRADTVEAQWEIVQNILDDGSPLFTYEQGTWGPAESNRLLPPGTSWHNP